MANGGGLPDFVGRIGEFVGGLETSDMSDDWAVKPADDCSTLLIVP